MPEYSQGEVAVPIPVYKIYTKEAWTDPWTEESNVILVELQDGANSQMIAHLIYHTGTIMREGQSDYDEVDPVEATRLLCMIELFSINPDGTQGDLAERWIGVIEQDDRDVLGRSEDSSFAVDQHWTMFGTERLLDAIIVTGSVQMTPHPNGGTGLVAARNDRELVFNSANYGTASGAKNRHFAAATGLFNPHTNSDESVYNPGSGASFPAPSAFGMVSKLRTGDEADKAWTIGDILNYLVSFYGPRFDLAFSIGFRIDTLERVMGLEPTTESERLAKHLFTITSDGVDQVTNYSPNGRTLFQCLNDLCRPERGLGWRMDYDDSCREGTAGPRIVIFAINNDSIEFDSTTLPASPLHAPLIITGRQDVTWSATRSGAREYGRIIIRGERVLSCFPISHADGSLDKGWTSAQETAYATPPGAGTGTSHDHYLQRVNYRARSGVWSDYIVNPNWDFKAKNGEGSGSATVVNPTCSMTGSLIEKPGSRVTLGRRLERFIPIEDPQLAGDTDIPAELRHMEAQVFAKATNLSNENIWFDLIRHEYPHLPQASVSIDTNRLGVRVACVDHHSLSGSNSIERVSPKAVVDWTQMIIVVAMRTETCVSVQVIVAGGDPYRWLTVDVPGAELWLVAPGTPYDINPDGTLVRTGAGTRIVRDDRPRLNRIAAMAKAWYSVFRRSASLSFNSITVALQTPPEGEEEEPGSQPLYIGLIADEIVEVSNSAPLNSVIWRRRINFVGNSTSYATIDAAPNFATV